MVKPARITSIVSRRAAMRIAGGAALTLGGVAAAHVPAASAAPGQEIVGVWQIGNAALGSRLVIYNADGTVTATQSEPRTPQMGLWLRTGDSEFLVRTLSFHLDAQSNQIGTYDVRLDATVAPDGNSYSGPLVQREYDDTGALIDTVRTTVSGTRVVTMPL